MSKTDQIPNASRHFRLWSVLDRMIAKDLLLSFSSILTVLVMIIVSQKFIRVLSQAIEGNIANETVISLLAFKTIIVTASFFPVACFMAVLMVMGRMYRDQEIAAIASAGGGFLRLFKAIIFILIPLSACSAALSLYAAPWAEEHSRKMTHNDEQTADIRSITPGRFSEYRSGELIFYAESLDASNGKLRNVFIQNKQGSRTGIANAELGHIENRSDGSYLVLENGERIQGIAGEKDFAIEKYREYSVLIERNVSILSPSAKDMPINELLNALDNVWLVSELQERLSNPISLVLLGILALPLSRISPRGGVYGNMLLAFGIYFIYSNLQKINHSWVESGKIPITLGFFWINLLLLVLIALLLTRTYGINWLKTQWRDHK